MVLFNLYSMINIRSDCGVNYYSRTLVVAISDYEAQATFLDNGNFYGIENNEAFY